jgi:hypothetical protein
MALSETDPELKKQLVCQCVVMCNHERGALHGCHHIGHRERLSTARNAKQDLRAVPSFDAGKELFNGARLVTSRLHGGLEFERGWHGGGRAACVS